MVYDCIAKIRGGGHRHAERAKKSEPDMHAVNTMLKRTILVW